VREWIEQALQTNWLKVKIRGEGVDAECRRCRMQIETVSQCGVLAQLEYKARHDRMESLLGIAQEIRSE